MVNINFNLKDKKKETTSIYLIIRWNGLRLKYSTGIAVSPKEWDIKKQQIKVKRITGEPINGFSERKATADSYNVILNDKKNVVESIYNDFVYQHKHEPTSTKEFKFLLDKTFKSTPIDRNEFYTHFNNYKETKTPTTKKWYDNTYNTLIKLRPNLDFNDIDLLFYNQFVKHLKDKNLGKNTIAKHIQNLKAFLNWATDNGINKNLIFKSKAFKKETEKSDNIALTNFEVNKLFELDLTDKPKLDKVRDLFIVGARTGLRFADFNKIHLENIKGDFIEIDTIKTGVNVVIPIHPQVNSIIDKYKGLTYNSLPEPISNQKFNDYIKDVCELVEGMDKNEIIISTKGGKRTEVKKPRFKRVSSHTCRRTFITLNYELNVPVKSIMSATGHKTSEFVKYIKTNSKTHAEIIASYWENE